MATIKIIENKNKSISYKVIIRTKGVFLTKTFPVKGNNKRTVYRDAQVWALNVENSINDGTYKKEHKKRNYTVREAIERYIEEGNPKNVKEYSKIEHIRALNWYKKEIGNVSIKTLDRSDLKCCRDKLMNKQKEIPMRNGKIKLADELISNSCVNKYQACFSSFLSHCVYEYEIITTNPMIGAKLKLRENDARKGWLAELKDRQLLLESCKKENYDLYLMTLIILLTGARNSEIINMTWKNTDFENKAICFSDTKNGTDRAIAMPEILYTELKQYKEQNKLRNLQNDYVFISKEGKQATDYLMNKVFPKLIQKLNIDKIVFYELRHTFSSIGGLIGINTDIMDIITGHRNGRMTSRYTHADVERLREPLNKIANYMLYGKTVAPRNVKESNT